MALSPSAVCNNRRVTEKPASPRTEPGRPGSLREPPPPGETSSGIPIEPFYGQSSPGDFPFTRGITPEMYRSRLWTMRQYAG
ncbi:MAG TPA: methylmalonyl-CoA mutase family protein, partial [Thermoanaerobaculia bacterium]|nr:methylmalonyl-CoA mutase family protein [Thermoanaerobaculia bacterium]